MSARYRAVLWDIDGVLIDSEPLHFDNIVGACARYGYVFTEDDCRRALGTSFGEMWRMIPGLQTMDIAYDDLMVELVDAYVERVRPDMARAPAPDVIAALAGRGVPMAAASSSPRRIVDANIAAVGVGVHLTAWLAREDAREGKPAPDLYLEAARRINCAPADCLVIEDTSTGVAAGKAAGMTVIAWPHAMTASMDFSQADRVVDDLAAVDWSAVG